MFGKYASWKFNFNGKKPYTDSLSLAGLHAHYLSSNAGKSSLTILSTNSKVGNLQFVDTVNVYKVDGTGTIQTSRYAFNPAKEGQLPRSLNMVCFKDTIDYESVLEKISKEEPGTLFNGRFPNKIYFRGDSIMITSDDKGFEYWLINQTTNTCFYRKLAAANGLDSIIASRDAEEQLFKPKAKFRSIIDFESQRLYQLRYFDGDIQLQAYTLDGMAPLIGYKYNKSDNSLDFSNTALIEVKSNTLFFSQMYGTPKLIEKALQASS